MSEHLVGTDDVERRVRKFERVSVAREEIDGVPGPQPMSSKSKPGRRCGNKWAAEFSAVRHLCASLRAGCAPLGG